ncbi:MAG: SH3 domain-containing protein [Deltaproteobacteria bacterium]|nr:SH3 domain-containing protein [Deltaproteobacteria bacterium]
MTHRSLLLAAALMTLAACGGTGMVESESITGADEATAVDSELSSSVPVGSTLQATTNVNLRTGASTGYSILLVVPNGAKVTTVENTTPTNGFYKVKYSGTVGYSHGTYYKLVSSPSTSTDPESNSREAAINRAKATVGFSYWWGHARFKPEGPSSSNAGSCSGSCPSCSHSGSYGADCSGMAGKVWQVGSNNSDLTVDNHPYSTYNFAHQTTSWHSVARDSMEKADAMVYNINGSGHIFIYESGDSWGSLWSYECRNCGDGCVRNLRTATSEYRGIGRNGY